MINSKRFGLALVALAASASALTAVPAQAAASLQSQSQVRIQSAATAQVASLVDSPISAMRCRDDGQGCPPTPTTDDCYTLDAPTHIGDLSQPHMQQRMQERGIGEQDVQDAVRIGARTAQCQSNGRWKYELGIGRAGATLVIIVAWDNRRHVSVAVTSWWA
ncbi:hypothetical protein Slala03_73700 [Streptomyces lavendulae subsp. lavendulae]|uniref:DUF4258 domain-containing protein n=1 Tax=Streptomyces lavendulae TaxID=1914 RepID=UPI0024A57EB8|nr:DUF4258 domain-containing protein [Streptomyces lavendulae]GLV87681.1 hypothetical protein Slala03_73700 [Streptomyces lavendulae subsp. lavendulae]